MEKLTLLCVHGVGHGDADSQLIPTWTKAITDGLKRWNSELDIECDFVPYDDFFSDAPLDPATVAEALAKLSYSGVVHGLGDLLGLSRDLGALPDTLRWTAGMVAQWADNDDLRKATRQQLLDYVGKYDPHIIVAHSLGSLISYDTFARVENKDAIDGRDFISLGSQIGNPFVRDALGGRIVMPPAEQWFHLYNIHDKAFTSPISISNADYQQVPTPFDIDFLDHDAVQYLSHPNTVSTVWRSLAGGPPSRQLVQSSAAVTRALKKPARRALLVGINDYPDPANRLEGCVNDVFLMSSVLQECGFAADDIRVVLNDRATCSGILDRLSWLLDGSEDGQDRVFFYSGHGAQIPDYGVKEKVDHMDECLVPYDFDWTPQKAVTDVQFHELYSQLPYQAHFLAVFDCCHSGGMTRDSGPRVRGITPPDDIRHRMLQWNADEQMWEPRKIEPENPDAGRWKRKVQFVGESGVTRRLGRAMALRSLPDKTYDAERRAFGHRGPFLPVIFEACQENQLSYEYRHGVTSYGAFTYSVTQIFREYAGKRKRITWKQLVQATHEKLERMRYPQDPVLVGPRKVLAEPVPWRPVARKPLTKAQK